MSVITNKNEGCLTFKLSGRFDIKNSNEFYQAVFSDPDFEAAAAAQADFKNGVCLDCLDMSYMSSAGLRIVVLMAKKVHPNKIKVLCTPDSSIVSLFEVSGILSFMDISYQ